MYCRLYIFTNVLNASAKILFSNWVKTITGFTIKKREGTVQSNLQGKTSSAVSTDKKEKKIFLIYKEIQTGAVAKSYMMNAFLIYEKCANIQSYLRSPLVIQYMTLQPLPLNFLIYEQNLIFFFVSVAWLCVAKNKINPFLHRERQRPMRIFIVSASYQTDRVVSWGTVSIQKYSAHSKV